MPARRHSSASCANAIDAGSFWTRRRRSSIRWLSAIESYWTVTWQEPLPCLPRLSVTLMMTVLVPVVTNECEVSGPCVLVLLAPEAGSPKFHEKAVIVAPLNTWVFRALRRTVVPIEACDGDAVHVGIGLPLTTLIDCAVALVRPVLSVTTRLTTKVPVAWKTWVVMPSDVHAASPGQCTIGVESPKFQSSE